MYNNLISVFGDFHEYQTSINYFNQLKEQGLEPDRITYTGMYTSRLKTKKKSEEVKSRKKGKETRKNSSPKTKNKKKSFFSF